MEFGREGSGHEQLVRYRFCRYGLVTSGKEVGLATRQHLGFPE